MAMRLRSVDFIDELAAEGADERLSCSDERVDIE
jgi:hypothetical protein